jgi:hypothetical protein
LEKYYRRPFLSPVSEDKIKIGLRGTESDEHHSGDTQLLSFGTFPIVWYSRKHDVSETGPVYFLR